MLAWDTTVLVALIAVVGVALTAAGTGAGAWLNHRTEKRKVDAGAYERAERIYKSALDALQEQVADLLACRVTDREELCSLRTRVRGLEAEHDRDHRRIDELVEYVLALQRILRSHRIEHPPGPDGHGLPTHPLGH